MEIFFFILVSGWFGDIIVISCMLGSVMCSRLGGVVGSVFRMFSMECLLMMCLVIVFSVFIFSCIVIVGKVW